MSVEIVRFAGPPGRRGVAVGRALADRIHRSLAFYRGFFERRGLSPDELPERLGPYREATERALPAMVEEIDGMAQGADVPPWELFAANAWEELEPMMAAAPVERCTAFAVTGSEGTVLGHNEQWYAGDAGNTAVVVAEPDQGPAFASPTVVTCLPAVGMNAAGLAQGVMSLTARDDGEGVPRVPVSSSALRASSEEEHLRRASMPGRSGGYAYVVARDGGRTFTVETSATSQVTLGGVAGHTNHYLAPSLMAGGLIDAGSVSRLNQLRALLDERNPRTPEGAMSILSDHQCEPQAICVHPKNDDGDEAVGVLFSMVCHLEERRMWVADGNPCTSSFEEIDLDGVLR
ncbi:MAG: C45 family autoproteolytic acyltransferase/hydrolase [Actinomycetota bacterium]